MRDVIAKHTHASQQPVAIETQPQMESLSIGGGWNKNGAAATIDPRDASQKISARYDVICERFLRRAAAVEAFGLSGVS